VLSGDRTSRDRETHGAVPGRANPEIPMVKSQPRGISTPPRALTYQFPECRNSDVTQERHMDSTMPPGSHSAPSLSGLRGSRNPRLQVLCCWKPRMPNPRCSGFVPPVPPGIDGPDQIGGSHFASLTCMRPLHSPPRFVDVRWKWVLCARRLKSLAFPSANQWYTRVRGSPRSAPVADPLPRENPPLVTFVLCN
jgi:hypothetical protein